MPRGTIHATTQQQLKPPLTGAFRDQLKLQQHFVAEIAYRFAGAGLASQIREVLLAALDLSLVGADRRGQVVDREQPEGHVQPKTHKWRPLWPRWILTWKRRRSKRTPGTRRGAPRRASARLRRRPSCRATSEICKLQTILSMAIASRKLEDLP